jgi:hypothetical protein
MSPRFWHPSPGCLPSDVVFRWSFKAKGERPPASLWLRRINAETQRFAEERRERRKKKLFASALLRALCVSALRLV